MPQDAQGLKETASQTAGPYVHIGLAPGAAGFDIYERELGWDIAGPHADGERIHVTGRVIDGEGVPLKDVLIEIWQANSKGQYPRSGGEETVEKGFRGWGRAISDFESGEWRFDTVKPGKTPGASDALQAPHLSIWIVARGINIGLHTRMYFEDEAKANAVDPTLHSIDAERRDTLIATRSTVADQPHYRFDIILQGDNETVFFDI